MTMTTPVARPVATVARRVRASVAVALVVTTIGLLAMLVFAQVGGLRSEPTSTADLPGSVRAELVRLESRGMQCTTRPELVDVVVLELDDGTVSHRSFTDAIALVRADAATALGYCD